MTDRELKKYTLDFDDVKSVINKRKALKRQETRLRRRLKRLESKYSFLKDLVGINASNTIITNAIKAYFMELGFNKIEIIPEKSGIEDLRLWVDNKLFIIEATGTGNKDNNETKALQIIKHIPSRQRENPAFKVLGVFISNHDNKKPLNERNTKSFDKRLIEFAESYCTITTTIDLFNAFINIKKGLLTPNELIDKLTVFGELKI
jgi:hypothetical protein